MGFRDMLKKLFGKPPAEAPAPKPSAVQELSEQDLNAVAGGKQEQPREGREQPNIIKPPYP